MAAIALDPYLSLQITKDHKKSRVVVEEIEGLLRVYRDGKVERPQVVPCVTSSLAPEFGVTCRDKVIDKFTNVWARLYVPNGNGKVKLKLPLLVYFHGGGFCVGSAAWSCYHDFLALLASRAGCMIMSVNYRLAPENPLPAAYEDGLKALMWVKQQALTLSGSSEWWSRKCNFSSIFLGGDSAGANIAYNVGIRLSSKGASAPFKPLNVKGNILIQPFFGGEARTNTEKYMVQQPGSALSLAASDTYWRLSLPPGTNRDHPWCNPGSIKMEEEFTILETMVCIAELDILKDRNMEFSEALASAGTKVENVMCKGVGHAFQVLNKSQISQTRTHEMICHIKGFITTR